MGKKGNGNGNGAGNIPLWWMGISFFIYYSSLSTCPDDWISLYLPSLPSGSLLLYFFFFFAGYLLYPPSCRFLEPFCLHSRSGEHGFGAVGRNRIGMGFRERTRVEVSTAWTAVCW